MRAHVYMRAITPNPQSRRKGKGGDNEKANMYKGQVGPSLLRCAVDNTVVFYCNGGRQLAAALCKTRDKSFRSVFFYNVRQFA